MTKDGDTELLAKDDHGRKVRVDIVSPKPVVEEHSWVRRLAMLREIDVGVDDTVFVGGVMLLALGGMIDLPVAAAIGVAHILTRRLSETRHAKEGGSDSN